MIKIGEIIPKIGDKEFKKIETPDDFLSSVDYDILDLEHQGEPLRIYHFQHDYRDLPHLGAGYFFKGGAARCVLMHILNRESLPPRDIDIVSIDDFNPDISLSNEYAKRGYDVEFVDLTTYFMTRDFSINEVLADNQNLYCTFSALRDSIGKIIRPSDYEKEWNEGEIKSKLVMKALRILSEFCLIYGEGKIEDIADWQFQIDNISLFALALSLDKACQSGDKVAGMFLTKLIETGIVELENNGSNALVGTNTSELAVNIAVRMIDEGDYFTFRSPKLAKATEFLMDEYY